MHLSGAACAVLVLLAQPSHAIDLDVNSRDSLTSAAKAMASSIMAIYGSNPEIPGLFPQPYYWWQGGLAFDSLINYWSVTGDDTYVDATREALLWQMGNNADFAPANQTKSLGNDDQSTWALAAMTAAEKGFSPPSVGGANVSWLRLAQDVFDEQAARWDTTTCGGGLRWQIFAFNAGYNYKNTAANGNFMQLAARLARFTGNQTYGTWAERTLNWTQTVGLKDNGSVYTGTVDTDNCATIDHLQWTLDYGTILSASSYMANFTQQDKFWISPVLQLVPNIKKTFATAPKQDVVTEVACQSSGSCSTDQLAYRAVLARALANERLLVPVRNANFVTSTNSSNLITAILQASAQGAAAQCVVNENMTVCGSDWTATTWDGSSGLGQSVSALEMVLANMPSRGLQNANSSGMATPTASNGTNGTSPMPVSSSLAASGTVPTNGASIGAESSMLAFVGGLTAVVAAALL